MESGRIEARQEADTDSVSSEELLERGFLWGQAIDTEDVTEEEL